MESIWIKTAAMPQRISLTGNRKAEVAVIGGGMAGILTAAYLERQGKQVIVLEASRIGNGQTKHTTAKITSQHGLFYEKLRKKSGTEKARLYAEANTQAVLEYKRFVRERHIECEYESCPAYLYDRTTADQLELEREALQSLGIAAELTKKTTLPFPVAAALRQEEQAQFHPLLFLKAMAEPLTIYENTPVRAVEENRILTDQGTVEAEQIVFTVHFPFLNSPGYYFMRMHRERSYVVALKQAGKMDGMYYGIEEGALSFRNSGEYLLAGGAGHRTGENKQGGRYDTLLQQVREYWPGCQEAARWSAQDCITIDEIPYIGRFCASRPDWYVATGFRKWGMSHSMAAAMLLSDLICGRQNPYEELFTPQRFSLSSSAKHMVEDGLKSAAGLLKETFYIPKEKADEIRPGFGGILKFDGKKAGVYKEENGTLHIVSAKCPHLGCQLEWNPDEKSFDCPCHGSRFSYTGDLIDNPAQKGIELNER